jgi:hypothetical protein
MNKIIYLLLFSSLLCFEIAAQSEFIATSGRNTSSASGTFTDLANSQTCNWTLELDSSKDPGNVGGPYNMGNPRYINDSSDVNPTGLMASYDLGVSGTPAGRYRLSGTFMVGSCPTYFEPQITIFGNSQSNSTPQINGRYTVTWTGGGMAAVNDPNNDLENLATGDMIPSGTTFYLNGCNPECQPGPSSGNLTWSLVLPQAVDNVEFKINRGLRREAFSFDVALINTRPIPTLSQWGLILLSLSFLIFGLVAVRRKTFVST